jgi:hypothetical protein
VLQPTTLPVSTQLAPTHFHFYYRCSKNDETKLPNPAPSASARRPALLQAHIPPWPILQALRRPHASYVWEHKKKKKKKKKARKGGGEPMYCRAEQTQQ